MNFLSMIRDALHLSLRLAPPERTFVRRAEVSLGRDVAVS